MDYSIVAYDGRAKRDRSIVDEGIIKAQMVNSLVCVGYTGTLELAQGVIEVLNSPQNKDALRRAKSDDVAYGIKRILEASTYPETIRAQFLATGENRAGIMSTYIVDGNKCVQQYVPQSETKHLTTVLSSGKHGLDFNTYLQNAINTYGGLAPVIIKDAMTRFIKDVARVDDSVNDKVRFVEIFK